MFVAPYQVVMTQAEASTDTLFVGREGNLEERIEEAVLLCSENSRPAPTKSPPRSPSCNRPEKRQRSSTDSVSPSTSPSRPETTGYMIQFIQRNGYFAFR